MIYISNLAAINALCIAGGGTGGHRSNLAGINELVTQLGGSTTYRNELSGINALITLSGGTGNYNRNILALNALCVIVGGEGGWVSNRLAWSEIATIGLGAGNTAPLIIDQTFTVAENSANGTVVGTVVATDADNDPLFFSIIYGNDYDIFAIDEDTGELTILSNTNLDYETHPQIVLVVNVSDGSTSSQANITVNVTYNLFTDTDLIGHYQGLVSDAEGYYFEDQIPTSAIHTNNPAKIVESHAVRFGNAIDVGKSWLLLNRTNCGITEDSTQEFYFKIKINSLSQTNKYIYRHGGWGAKGFVIGINGNKLKLQERANGDTNREYESTVVIPDTIKYYDLLVTVVKKSWANRAQQRVYIDYAGNARETWNQSALNIGEDINSANTPTIGDLTSDANSADMSIVEFWSKRDGVLTSGVSLAQNHQAGLDSNATPTSFDVYDYVTGGLLVMRHVNLLSDCDSYPINILHGYQLFVRNNLGVINENNNWKIPYKSDGTPIFTSPVNYPGTATVTGYDWIGNFPAGDGHNFSESKVKLGVGNVKTIHELCNISTEKYFINPLDSALVSEMICYNSIQSDYKIDQIFNYLGITDLTGWYGVEWDKTAITNPLCNRVNQSGFTKMHYILPIQRKMRACTLNANGTVNYYLDGHDWTKKLDGSASVLDGTDGDVMIEIPEHYVKFEESGNTQTVKMALATFTGATKISRFYISAYNASLNSLTDKLHSVKNLTATYRGGDHGNPTINTWRKDWSAKDATPCTMLGKPTTQWRRNQFRNKARAKGDNWNIEFYLARKTIVWLQVVEFGNRDLQKDVVIKSNGLGHNNGGLGRGVTNFISIVPIADMWADIARFFGNTGTVLPFTPIGTSDSLGNFSGEIIHEITGFAARTGTITTSTSSKTVTASGGAFTTELLHNSVIYKIDGTYIGSVDTIESNNSLTLIANALSTNVGISYKGYNYINVNRYRGIECPLWGDLLYMMDGVNIKHDGTAHTITAYIFDNPANFAESTAVGASRTLENLPNPESGDFAPITEIFFGENGDIIAKAVDGIGGNKENPTAYADRYHSGNNVSGGTINDDGWWINIVGNDIYACGLLGRSAGPFFQWAMGDDTGNTSGDQQNIGCKIICSYVIETEAPSSDSDLFSTDSEILTTDLE